MNWNEQFQNEIKNTKSFVIKLSHLMWISPLLSLRWCLMALLHPQGPVWSLVLLWLTLEGEYRQIRNPQYWKNTKQKAWNVFYCQADKHTTLSLNLLQLSLFLLHVLLLFQHFRRLHVSYVIVTVLCCLIPLLQNWAVLIEQVCRTKYMKLKHNLTE